MGQEAQAAHTGSTNAVPLLFGKRRALSLTDARQYEGTDTDRDIKG